ncbi:bifunctional DNA-formamidopyrimidine glycosylase/DNA-(apurinic or apyrimidinic site) lyase [Chitinimonas koreensis]|uniref:bifunctional DNA-formamidopyrimidine glycosylase/DNA-(apurinic or apyrimidinic site) lyase n=1 Tax=Chitinimonas koreensis TaxID=356302 RepID=UPI0003F971A5|nr:bifunctional DNA-formamidopyrimidine glycosylase/DNA-(apurinic or apyrimidinic site) lyase [Chitinimonas koreensis]QNM97126.1 bifunctional DNA-formamidopyrimidine glycosylase/DNA-(apurinic or apyrimidinic site) lyase [Chitinimonas koreensis]
MPELPEVETTRRGIETALTGRTLLGATVREPRLRWPIPPDLAERVAGRTVQRVWRRAKYLLLDIGDAHLILHLGMSGSLRVLSGPTPPERHDHVDLELDDGCLLRYRDPRRFGALLWVPGDPLRHALLASLGPEPLEAGFDADYLRGALKGKSTAIKLALMDNHLVVGVGNIYANESLFRAGIAPQRPAGKLTRPQCERLVQTVRETLAEAIVAGGSTLRDFVDSAGKPGYFQQRYFVYGRTEEPCLRCGTPIRQARLGQRSTYWCPECQPR